MKNKTPDDQSNTFDTADFKEYLRRRAMVAKAFSPSAPISQRQLFSGRHAQMNQLVDSVHSHGRHAVIYGDRGVGKTSLARVVMAVATSETGCLSVFHTCSGGETFDSVWTDIFGQISITEEGSAIGFGAAVTTETTAATALLGEAVTPNAVVRAIQHLTRDAHVLIFVDEFDNIRDKSVRERFADTLKILSDSAVNSTIVLIGVGETIDDLMSDHASIDRCLAQIEMKPMQQEELAEIIRQGTIKAEMVAAEPLIESIVQLCQGLPHYAHLLGQHAAFYALSCGRLAVGEIDYRPAIAAALGDVSQTAAELYTRATFSPRETLHRAVLLACARARKDSRGWFGAPDVRAPLLAITGRDYDVSAFSQHLSEFSSVDLQARGGILRKRGKKRMFRYRFVNPLVIPYTLMRGETDDDLAASDDA